MFWGSVLILAQAVNRNVVPTQDFKNGLSTVQKIAVRSPTANHLSSFFGHIQNGRVVIRADRICNRSQNTWIGRSEGKGIADNESAKASRNGPAFAPLDGRIVLDLVGGGGIQENAEEGRDVSVLDPPKRITKCSTGRERGTGVSRNRPDTHKLTKSFRHFLNNSAF